MNIKFPALVAVLLPLCFLAPARVGATAPKWTYLGEYSNIKESQESGDCDGYAVRLWKVAGQRGPDRIVGTFVHADGPCDKSPTPLYDVSYAPDTHSLTFAAPNDAEQIPETYTFAGVIHAADVTGVIRSVNQPGASVSATTVTLRRR